VNHTWKSKLLHPGRAQASRSARELEREKISQTIAHEMINDGKITNYINFIFMFFAMFRILLSALFQ
jgi:hypothetical protein